MRPNRFAITWVFAVLSAFPLWAQAQDRHPEYLLGPGDSVRITVFQNPDLTVETRLSENGAITYPLIGVMRIGGMTIQSAEQAIAKALSGGGFIQQPQVNITLLQNRGYQVSVLGLVGRPGRYPLETVDTRLSQMLAIAGGIAATGADIIILTGTRDGKPLRKEIDVPGMFLDNKLEDDVTVAGGDVIYVHTQPMYYIYGFVQRPGSFRVERRMTVRQALALGGGPTERGTERGLRIFRRNAAGKVETVAPDPNDAVQPGDVLYVQDSLF